MIAAIDPGMAGGFAWVPIGAKYPTVSKMPPTPEEIIQLLWHIHDSGINTLAVEQPGKAIFGAGASYLAVLHHNHGIVLGAALALGFDVQHILPKVWQRAVGMKRIKTESKVKWKSRLKTEAIKRFPRVLTWPLKQPQNLKVSPQPGRITLDVADALLILAATAITQK